MVNRRRWGDWTLGLALGWLAAAGGGAQADGTVVAIQQATERGGWSTWQAKAGTTSGEAFVVRGDTRVPLAVGDTVRDDDLVVTRRGRVRIEVPDKGEITVYDATVVSLQDYGLRHVLGGVLIEVQDAFRVEYAQTRASVEGTQFRVEGDARGDGYVAVVEGKVRVANEAGDVLVEAGKVALVGATAAPDARTATRAQLSPRDRRSHPVSVGPRVGLGRAHHLGLEEATAETRTDVFVRWHLPGPFSVSAASGFAVNPETAHVPVMVGVEAWTGPLGFGLAMERLIGYGATDSTDSLELTGAGAGYGTVNLSVPLAPRVSFESQALLGYSTGVQATGMVGVSMRP